MYKKKDFVYIKLVVRTYVIQRFSNFVMNLGYPLKAGQPLKSSILVYLILEVKS